MIVPLDDGTYTDDQIDPYSPPTGDGYTASGTTQPTSSLRPGGSATTDPVGSGFSLPAETPQTETLPGPATPPQTTPGASNMHLPGEIWDLRAGQGCAPGYAEQQTADGRWTCIPMSDFQKIFSGDFSPLSAGQAPAGVAPVAGNTLVYVGGVLQGTAQAVAEAAGSTWGAITGTAPVSSTQGPTGGSAGGSSVAISDGGSAVNRLIDLASAMYAGAGVKGGGSGMGGLVSAPLSGTGGGSAPASSSGKGLVIVIILGAAGLAFWYYSKHKRKAAA